MVQGRKVQKLYRPFKTCSQTSTTQGNRITSANPSSLLYASDVLGGWICGVRHILLGGSKYAKNQFYRMTWRRL